MNEKNDNFVPAYVKIQNYIFEKIQNGTYAPGDKIPSENELSRLFSVNRNTVNMAIKELSITGVVQRVRGKGTFVSDPANLPSDAKVLSPQLHLKQYGAKSHTLERCSLITLPDELCQKFQLPSQAKGYEIIRSLYRRGTLEALDYSYVPSHLVLPESLNYQQMEQSYFHNFLKTITKRTPAYMKIYVNTPKYPFLNIERFFLPEDSLLIWSTDILDKEQKVLGTTITVSPDSHGESAFITFSIE